MVACPLDLGVFWHLYAHHTQNPDLAMKALLAQTTHFLRKESSRKNLKTLEKGAGWKKEKGAEKGAEKVPEKGAGHAITLLFTV